MVDLFGLLSCVIIFNFTVVQVTIGGPGVSKINVDSISSNFYSRFLL